MSIVAFSAKDALYDEGKKVISKQLKLLAIGLLLVSQLIVATFDTYMIIRLICAYPLIWLTFYDLTYNLIRKLPWHYHGTTSGWYTTYRNKVGGLHFLYVIMALILGVSLFYMQGSII